MFETKYIQKYCVPVVSTYQQCWKARSRNEAGELQEARGCISKPDHVPMQCGIKEDPLKPLKIDCCQTSYCNNGSFPVLPPADTSMLIKF